MEKVVILGDDLGVRIIQQQNLYLGVYPDAENLSNAAKTYGTSVLDDLETERGGYYSTSP